MKLISCYIENFGLIHAQEFKFSKGLNCCISENGTGKTTLAAFIEAMLYGIGDTRRQALDENPRKKYMPWQGGKFGGSLTIEVGKKKYVIERSFGQRPADDTLRLIDKDSGKVSEDYGEDIGEKLFGIDRDGFLRTAYLSEKNLQGKNDNKSISAKLSDLVGVDGDVGGFDEAIKVLEDRRKFYFKKGNTGEIANVKERINECQRRIDSIAQLEENTHLKEQRLKELNDEKARLLTLENEQKTKLELLRKQKEISVHEERYATMLDAMNKEKERLESTKLFFARHLPVPSEIDGARDAYTEAKRLKDEALSEKGNEEMIALGEFFKRGTNFAEIADIERAAELAEEKANKLELIKSGADNKSVQMRALFGDEAPKRAELENAKGAARSKMKPVGMTLLFLGLSALIGGVVAGGTLGIALASVGIVLQAISVFIIIKNRKSKELLSFIRKYGNVSDSIEEIENRLTQYERLTAEREKERADTADEHSRLTLKVYDFLGKFPITDADSVLDSVKLIKHKYTEYYALGQAGEVQASTKLEKLKRSESLSNTAHEFLSKFPITTDSPFSEIRDKLNEYSYLKASVSRLEKDCDTYAVRYGVTGKTAGAALSDEVAVNATLAELNDRMKALTAESALVKREIDIEKAEIEKKDEYEMLKDELDELYRKHVDSLDIIKKTSGYLKEACDNITSKYLGKTKAKFEEYSKLISDIDGDFALNTSFELSRTERGESHGIESYSRGTRDAYALGLRLALIDALYENESPFIILDDPFIALDDTKLERAKATLKAIGKNRQILYFTCARSRAIE